MVHIFSANLIICFMFEKIPSVKGLVPIFGLTTFLVLSTPKITSAETFNSELLPTNAIVRIDDNKPAEELKPVEKARDDQTGDCFRTGKCKD
jgi:hypothetical protein